MAKTEPLPLMLSDVFEVYGAVSIGGGHYLWWLVSRANYEPESAEHLIENSGLSIRDDVLTTMRGMVPVVLAKEPKEIKSFKEYLEDGLLPQGAIVLVYHRAI